MNKFFFEKKFFVTAVIYFLLSGIILYTYGIQLGGEAEKYIDNANRILNRQELRNGVFGFFYLVYSLLVALFVKLSVNLAAVAVVQIILSFLAGLALYALLLSSLGNKTIAFIFFLAFLLCYPVQKWNFYLYSESLHNSLLVIGIYFFDKLLRENKPGQLLVFGILILLILFSRPVGLLFLLSFLVVLITWFYRNKKKLLFYLTLTISLATVVIIVNSPAAAFINPDSLKRMEVICQVPETNADSNYREFNRQGLYKAYTVIKDEVGFGNFFMNGFKKLGYFFCMYRGYYSWQNNLLLICFTVFYPFALIGTFAGQGQRFNLVKLFSISYLIYTSLAIFFTCDDWANRFISPLFPFILILASGGVLTIYNYLKKI